MSDEVEVQTHEEPATGIGTSSLSRREMLKKSAIAGGVALWAVPAVEMVGTKLAAAASTGVVSDCLYGVTGLGTFCGATVTVSYNKGLGTTSVTEKATVNSATSGACSGFSSTPSTGDIKFVSASSGEILFTVDNSGDDITFLSITVGGKTATLVKKGSEQRCDAVVIFLDFAA